MTKEEVFDTTELDMIEEVHARIDTLVDILEKKGICTKEEFEGKFEKLWNERDQ